MFKPLLIGENPIHNQYLWEKLRQATLDSEGRLLGVVSMPPRFTPTEFRGNKIYGVLRDESDVPYAARLRVVGDFRLETLM